jgi:hypothetical protein
VLPCSLHPFRHAELRARRGGALHGGPERILDFVERILDFVERILDFVERILDFVEPVHSSMGFLQAFQLRGAAELTTAKSAVNLTMRELQSI